MIVSVVPLSMIPRFFFAKIIHQLRLASVKYTVHLAASGLAYSLVNLLPLWPLCLDGTLFRQDCRKVHFSSSTCYIDILDPLELGLFDELEKYVKDDDDWCGEVGLKEALHKLAGGHRGVSDGCEASPELCYQDYTVEDPKSGLVVAYTEKTNAYSPTQDPMTPGCDLNASSSKVWPLYFQA
jgi:hypothetical protein